MKRTLGIFLVLTLLQGCKEQPTETVESKTTNIKETPYGQIALYFRGKTQPANPYHGYLVDNWAIINEASVPIRNIVITQQDTVAKKEYILMAFALQPKDSCTMQCFEFLAIETITWDKP
jgi:hypothetical protein